MKRLNLLRNHISFGPLFGSRSPQNPVLLNYLDGGSELLNFRKSLSLRSAPVRIRTSNLLIRSQMLYPVELRVLRLKTGRELSRP